MIRDAVRLAGALRGLVDQFGPAVLDDPLRLRNLLLDEYGVDARSERSDIDAIVTVLSMRVSETESLESAAAQVVSATGLSGDEARWAVSTMRSLSQPLEPQPGSKPEPPTVTTGGSGQWQASTVVKHTDGNARMHSAGESRPRWPVSAKLTVAALGMVATGMALIAFVDTSSSGARRDPDVRQVEATDSLEAVGSPDDVVVDDPGETADALVRAGLPCEVVDPVVGATELGEVKCSPTEGTRWVVRLLFYTSEEARNAGLDQAIDDLTRYANDSLGQDAGIIVGPNWLTVSRYPAFAASEMAGVLREMADLTGGALTAVGEVRCEIDADTSC